MILVAATWMGLYLAKRITRPVQMLATAADEIGAGHLDHRVNVQVGDEFSSLIEAFNRMAGDLGHEPETPGKSAEDLERRHEEVERQRQYVETVLDRIATGVISSRQRRAASGRGTRRRRGCSASTRVSMALRASAIFGLA